MFSLWNDDVIAGVLGCYTHGSRTVVIEGVQSVEYTDFSICLAADIDNYNLVDYIHGYEGGTFKGLGVFDSTMVDLTSIQPGVQEYTYRAIDVKNCNLTGSFEVTYLEEPNHSILGYEATDTFHVCVGSEALLSDEEFQPTYLYVWNFDDDSLSADTTDNYTFYTDTTKIVNGTVRKIDRNTGCYVVDNFVVKSHHFEGEVSVFPREIEVLTLVTLQNNVVADSYKWKFSTYPDHPAEEGSVVTYAAGLEFSWSWLDVTLEVSNRYGCSAVLSFDSVAYIIDPRGSSGIPNPNDTITTNVVTFTDELFVVFPVPVTNTIHWIGAMDYVIFDIVGNNVLTGYGSEADISLLNSGMYLIQSKNENKKSKFIIQ